MSTSARIVSRQHPLVRRCRRLAAGRGDGSAVLLDGEHLLAEALAANVRVEAVLTDRLDRDVVSRAAAEGGAIYEASRAVLDAASPARSPAGVVSVAAWTPATPEEVLGGRRPLVIALLGVQDPGNVGSVIRSADALGASAVAVLDGSADPGGWKALRGAMGSTFRLPVGRMPRQDLLDRARARGLRVVAAAARGGTPLSEIDLRPPTLVLLGSEGAGLDENALAASDATLTVPMRAGVESLNVAVTAALVAAEAARQRGETLR